LEEARRQLEAARRARRVAEEQERSRGRTSEAAAREAAWQSAVLDRLREQLAAAGAELARVEASVAADRAADAEGQNVSAPAGSAADLKTLEAHVAAARSMRDQRSAALNEQVRRRGEADELRRRAEIGATMDERRLAEVEAERTRIAGSEADLGTQRERVMASLAAATAEEQAIGVQLDALLDAGRDERARLAAAETSAAAARERLRAAEARGRTAEVAEMQARLHADSARESLLVELAGIGPDGLAALRGSATADAPDGQLPPVTGSDFVIPVVSSAEELTPALESALDASMSRWRASVAALPEAPSPGRLASLRRRYQELGASNPFAAQEYAEIKGRLETLDAQRNDLESAIRSTRELIANLNVLIAEQFRRTFAQLEGAFARRFTQLFDGGEAQLSLTVPEDLAVTGVEIIARPPGKKRQPLAMLSGGERTLTAVALLLAMLEVRPVPFCVLDEVDAALDEANVGRFSAALRDLAETIQFVVITHNRGTIEAADALYGVTVGDDAVSRVVSMRLDGRDPRTDRNGHATAVPIEPDVVAVGPSA
jgi:chromosome segregation protein